jgi:hypothetical protein
VAGSGIDPPGLDTSCQDPFQVNVTVADHSQVRGEAMPELKGGQRLLVAAPACPPHFLTDVFLELQYFEREACAAGGRSAYVGTWSGGNVRPGTA